MKRIITQILLFLLVLSPGYHYLFSQCGVPNNLEIVPMELNRNMVAPVDVKMYVWIMREDDGSGGVSTSDVEDIMEEVYDEYELHDIFIDYCIRDLHNSNWLHEPISDLRALTGFPPCIGEDVYQLKIHDSWLPGGILGSAQVAGWGGWSIPDTRNVIHEIGHLFGLRHTHNNCNHPTLSETVIPQDCDALTCLETGDGICDTPADANFPYCNPAFTRVNCISSPTGEKDRCQKEYADPLNIVTNNYMSYYGNTDCLSFTDDQSMVMNTNATNSGRTGTFNVCSTDPITLLETGDLKDGVYEFTGVNITLNSRVLLMNADVTFKNCTIYFPETSTYFEMHNSELFLNNTKLLPSNIDNCGQDLFSGIYVLTGENRIYMNNNSLVEAEYPIFYTGNSTSDLIVNGNNYTLTGDDFSARLRGGGWFGGNNVTLNGTLSMGNDHDLSGIFLRNSEIFPTGSNNHGIKADDQYCRLHNVEISGFTTALEIVNPSHLVEILDSHIDGSASANSQQPVVKITDGARARIKNSYIEGSYIEINDVQQYDIQNNDFTTAVAEQVIILNTNHTGPHTFRSNELDGVQQGVKTIGNQSQAKFLCNEFTNTPANNFDWGIVDLLQGFDQQTASGNIFSTTLDQIAGLSSLGTIYNYRNIAGEALIVYSNPGVTGVTNGIIAAPCSAPGPDWDIGSGTPRQESDTDWLGGNHNLQESSDNYDLNQFFEDQFVQIENQINLTLADVQVNEKTEALESLLSLLDMKRKIRVLEIFNANPELLTVDRLESIFNKSNLFTEAEVVSMIMNHPIVLYSPKINHVVFNSGSFSNRHLDMMHDAMVAISDSDEVALLWKREALGQQKRNLIFDAIENSSNLKSHNIEMVNSWWNRLGGLSSHLQISDNLFILGNYEAAFAYLDNYIRQHDLTRSQGQDIYSYKTILSIISNIYTSDRRLDEMTKNELQAMRTIARSGLEFSGQKARIILSTVYDEFIEATTNHTTVDKLEFLNTRISEIQTRSQITKDFGLYPNPNVGQFEISNSGDQSLHFVLRDITGKKVLETQIEAGIKKSISQPLEKGVYIYSFYDVLGTTLTTSKMIVMD